MLISRHVKSIHYWRPACIQLVIGALIVSLIISSHWLQYQIVENLFQMRPCALASFRSKMSANGRRVLNCINGLHSIKNQFKLHCVNFRSELLRAENQLLCFVLKIVQWIHKFTLGETWMTAKFINWESGVRTNYACNLVYITPPGILRAYVNITVHFELISKETLTRIYQSTLHTFP